MGTQSTWGVWCRLLIMRLPLLSSLLLVTVSSYKSYTGYQVLRTGVLTKEQSDSLREEQNGSMLDFWKEPAPGHSADIMASSSELESVMTWLASNNITFHTMVEDVEQLIQDTKPSPKSGKSAGKRYTMDWADYHDIDVLNEFIESLAETNDFASIIPIGKSYEGREMKVLAITKAGPGAPNIWLEAGIHAREWIAPAVATYIVRELVENYETILTIWTRSTGTLYLLLILTGMHTAGSMIGCGGRQGQTMALFWGARGLTLTGTGAFTFGSLVSATTSARRPTVDQKHSLSPRPRISVTLCRAWTLCHS